MERPQIGKEVDKHFYDISLTVDSGYVHKWILNKIIY